MYTTDREDPRLGHGIDEEKIPQHEVYLILSEEERAKGFIRPLRQSYVHVGKNRFKNEPRPLTEDEKKRHNTPNYEPYIAYIEYEENERNSSVVGRFFTEKQLKEYKNGGCKTVTTMSLPLAETYASNPKFYGATYCCGCQRHLDVNEFVWEGTEEVVGS